MDLWIMYFMRTSVILGLMSILSGVAYPAERSGDGEAAFRSLYKELVETNTSLSAGSCTLAAERMTAHLKAAGYSDSDVHVFTDPDHPKEGGLVAQLTGSDASRKAVLMLAHLDVVEAKRVDWARDPFTLVEEGGYFYARGASDDKAMVAVFTDLLIRFKQEGFRPKRTIRLALTCGEETGGAFNGAHYLATRHKDWIDAEFAINEGGDGELDAGGRRVVFGVEAAEKVYQDYQLESINAGGHSSQPVPSNAIYEMAAALQHVSALEFPIQFNDTTRAYFAKMSSLVGGDTGAAMLALLKDPTDASANAIVSADKKWHSMLRTTCVATMIDGGHATNALPQRVDTNVNCRIVPGASIESVRDAIAQAIGNPKVVVTIKEPRSPATPSPTLSPRVMKPIEMVSAQLFPGVPVLPLMETVATDGIYLTAAGIPTYGVSGLFVDPDRGNIHGLNERIRVKSLMDARRFQYRLFKLYADQ
jgi:acetylornithine deacetylase/succinyl-diaminopimelate desuccinylase-like protein